MGVADLTAKDLKRFARLGSPPEREAALGKLDKFLTDRSLTWNDAPAILARAQDLKPKPPAPDPRDAGPSKSFRKSVTPADAICELLRRYVVMPEHQYVLCTLWILHTFVFEQFEITPRLHVRSPVPNCGKTVLLNFVKMLSSYPKKLGNVSAAGLYRLLDVRPKHTILLDEFQNLRDQEAQGTLWAILDDGWEKGSELLRVIRGHERYFDLFAPVVSATNKPLWKAEYLSRAIILDLDRAADEELAALQNIRTLTPKEYEIFVGAYRFAANFMREVKLNPDPQMPTFDRRHADKMRVLVSIADALGDAWGKAAREAAIATAYENTATQPENVLRHAVAIYREEGIERSIRTSELLKKLRTFGPAEGEWHGLTEKGLARLLVVFKLRTKQDWPPGPRHAKTSFWGYWRADLEQASRRYLRDRPTPATEPRLRLVSDPPT